MPTTYQLIKERLLESGDRGVTISDLHRQIRGEDVNRRNGTYHSFNRYFHILTQLGWVEFTGETEQSYQKGVSEPGYLSDRRYYKITSTGRSAPDDDWYYPPALVYPQFRTPDYTSRFKKPTGRPRGRPRRGERRQPARVVVERPVERPRAERPVIVPMPPPKAPSIAPGIPSTPERRRKIRLPLSGKIAQELARMLPRVEALAYNRTPEVIDAVENDLTAIFDSALDGLERSSGEERQRLEAIASRLEDAAEGFELLRDGLATGKESRYSQGLIQIRKCCLEE